MFKKNRKFCHFTLDHRVIAVRIRDCFVSLSVSCVLRRFKMRALILIAVITFVQMTSSTKTEPVNCKLYPEHIYKDKEYLKIKTCKVANQKIDNAEFFIKYEDMEVVDRFYIENEPEVEVLIEHISETFPKLMEYHVTFCAVKIISGSHFKGLRRLDYLKLGNNQIETIAGNAFKDLINLRRLELNNNQIISVETGLFRSLTNLQIIWLNDNKIDYLDEKTFEKLSELTELELSSNSLTTLPANLFKNNFRLGEIGLGYNKIKSIDSKMFDHLTDVWWVRLNDNVCLNKLYLFEKSALKSDLVQHCA